MSFNIFTRCSSWTTKTRPSHCSNRGIDRVINSATIGSMRSQSASVPMGLGMNQSFPVGVSSISFIFIPGGEQAHRELDAPFSPALRFLRASPPKYNIRSDESRSTNFKGTTAPCTDQWCGVHRQTQGWGEANRLWSDPLRQDYGVTRPLSGRQQEGITTW